MYGVPEEVFLNSRTSAEYVPPSEGNIAGFAVKVRLTSVEDAALDCFEANGGPGVKTSKENKNKAKSVRRILYFGIELDPSSNLENRVKTRISEMYCRIFFIVVVDSTS